jgi:hypothetical protein
MDFDNEDNELDNLLMNMNMGLLPENLCQSEIELLEQKYGNNWFEKLGYSEPKYKKPLNA